MSTCHLSEGLSERAGGDSAPEKSPRGLVCVGRVHPGWSVVLLWLERPPTPPRMSCPVLLRR